MRTKKLKNNLSNENGFLSSCFQLNSSCFNKKKEYLDGKPHTVTDAVMLVGNSIFCGNQGCFHYSSGAIARSVQAWNGKPITNGHPKKDDQFVSVGASTDVFNQFVVGTIFNASFVNEKLKAELWLDDEKCKDIFNLLGQGYSIDVSTGMFTEDSLNFSNDSIQGSVTEIYPDHLALLPGQQGACSLEDGCGIIAEGETLKRYSEYSENGPDYSLGAPVLNQSNADDVEPMDDPNPFLEIHSPVSPNTNQKKGDDGVEPMEDPTHYDD